MLNPCARESKERTGRFLERKLISDYGQFSYILYRLTCVGNISPI